MLAAAPSLFRTSLGISILSDESTQAPAAAGALTMDIEEIMRRLPHRYPFLLVDRVLECVSGKSIRALKNVTYNEPFFPGHFPTRPVLPGVIILEALAQTAGILAFVTAGVYPDDKRQLFFVGIDEARFRRPVQPGDQLILKATLTRSLRGIWKFSTAAEVDGVVVASADMMVAPGEARARPAAS
jgi:3-hydroxyacyl-[acyl-carrier-protein] dehydratase